MTHVIVIHGVGNQVLGDTAHELARTVANCANIHANSWPIRVHHDGELIESNVNGQVDHKVNVADMWSVDWNEGSKCIIHEFYWADESQVGEFFLLRFFSIWQIYAGLPRLGMMALKSSKLIFGGMLIDLSRWLFGLIWMLFIIRFIASLILQILKARSYLSSMQVNELLLPCDLLISSLCILLGITLLKYINRVEVRTSLIVLAITSLLLQVIPSAIVNSISPGAGSGLSNPESTPWYWFSVSGMKEKVTANWFYSPQTFPGILPYVCLFSVLMWFVYFVIRYGWLRTTETPSEAKKIDIAHQVESLKRYSHHTWFAISVLVLFASSFADCWNLLWLMLHSDPGYFASTKEAKEYFVFEACDLVFSLFVAAAAAILFSSKLRALSSTIFELVLDVKNYVTEPLFLDRWLLARYFFGGAPRSTPLAETLQTRLQTLLRELSKDAHNPPLIVAHSLGTIIALQTIQRLSADEKPKFVRLITLGSPLRMLVATFPGMFCDNDGKKLICNLPEVQEWINYFCSADLVGLELNNSVKALGATFAIHDVPLGKGGHTGYFTDSQIANAVLARINN